MITLELVWKSIFCSIIRLKTKFFIGTLQDGAGILSSFDY